MKRIFLCVMLILSLVCALPVQAALLEGNTVRWTYIYPEQGTISDTRDVVVGAGTEITNWHDYFSVNFSDTNIYIPYTWPDWYDISWDDVSFNGFGVSDLNGTIPDITSVTVNPLTNLVGLDASRIAFDANNIYVNWHGLPFDSRTIVSLDITGAQRVPDGLNTPLPAAVWLLGSGLIGLIGIRRRLNK